MKYLYTLLGLILGAILLGGGVAFAVSASPTDFGGTGTTTPSGILYGDNGSTHHLNTATIGSGLTFSGGILTASAGPTVVSTSTNETAGTLSYWTTNSATPALLGKVSTSTLTASSPLTGNFTYIGSGGSLGCQTASGSQAGCLASADWTTFNNKQPAGTYLTALGSGYGTTTGTTITHATSTLVFNGLTFGQTIVPSAGALLFTPTVTGTLSNAGLANSTIGATSPNSTLSFGSIASLGSTFTGDLNLGNSNWWTALQNFTNASTSQLTATSSVYLATLGGQVGIGTTSPFATLSLGNTSAPGTAWFNTSNFHIGSSTCPTPNSAVTGFGTEICGDDNSDGGVNLILGNKNAGTSAFGDLFMQNDASVGNQNAFAVLNFNSYGHTNTDFGTIPGTARGLQLYNTEGPLQLGSATTSAANNYIQFFLNTTSEAARFASTGNFGIATTAPDQKLSVVGQVDVDPTGSYDMADQLLGYASSTNKSTIWGQGAGTLLNASSTLLGDTYIGNNAGHGTPAPTIAAPDNTAIGATAGQAITVGNQDTLTGYGAGAAITNSNDNSAFGYLSLTTLSSAANFDTCVGAFACEFSTGGQSTVIGEAAMSAPSNSGGNTVVGRLGLSSDTSGSFNTAIGQLVGSALTTGSNNEYFGAETATTTANQTGSGNIIIGFDIDFPTSNPSNTLDIGNLIFGTGMTGQYRTIAGNIGIATSSPWKTLSVVGTMAVNGLDTSTSGNAVCILANFDVVTAGGTTCVTSSKYTKHNIQTLSLDAIAETMQLSTKQFTYNDSGVMTYGLIAEDVQKIDPKLVDHATSKTVLDGHTFNVGDPISIDSEHLSDGLLVKDVQELQNEISGKTIIVAHAARSAEENWQWVAIGLLFLWVLKLQVEIKRKK